MLRQEEAVKKEAQGWISQCPCLTKLAHSQAVGGRHQRGPASAPAPPTPGGELELASALEVY